MNFEEDIVAVYYELMRLARRYCRDERAYDLAAEAVCRALEARDRYDGSRPLLAWCRAIMRNVWRNAQRRLSTTHTQRLGEWDAPGGEEADQRTRVGDVMGAIAMCRSVCVPTLMDYARGYSMDEIARARGVPLGTVKRRIHDARHRLAKLVNVN